MPSSLAAFLTILFIVWIFRMASRESDFMRNLWIPTIWVAIFSAKMVGGWIGGENATLDGSPLDRNVLFALIVLGVVVLVRKQLDWSAVFQRNRWLFLYIAFCAISALWADYPFVAFKRWTKEFGTLVMVLIIVTEPDPLAALRKVFLRCAYVLIPLSILFIKYFLDIGRSYDEWTGEAMFCGVTNDKNALGRLSFVSALFLLASMVETRTSETWWGKMRRRLPDMAVFGMCVWLLLNANSSTAKACAGIGLLVFLMVRWTILSQRPRLLAVATVMLIVASFVALTTPDVRQIFAEMLNRKGDLTTRTDIWRGAFALDTNPIIGCGYGSVWLTPGGHKLQRELKMAHSHNGYLETYLNTGIVGLLLLLGAVVLAGKNALREVTEGGKGGALLLALFVSCVIYNYTEVGFGNISNVGVVMWMLAAWNGSRSLDNETSWSAVETSGLWETTPLPPTETAEVEAAEPATYPCERDSTFFEMSSSEERSVS